MKVEERKIYTCGYCPKYYKQKHFCEQHENMCKKNPKNKRACFGCNFIEKKETTVYEDSPMGGSFEFKKEMLFCIKKSIYVYPPKVEYKNNAIELGDELNEPMPKECDLFAEKEY